MVPTLLYLNCSLFPKLVADIFAQPLSLNVLLGVISIAVLLFLSALFSGSEVAFFSLSPKQLNDLRKSGSNTTTAIVSLLANPKLLLATLLIANNFVNIAIVIITSILSYQVFDFSSSPVLGVFIQVIAITFVIVLLGEVIPKVYASKNPLKLASVMAFPILFFNKLFSPLSTFLIMSSNVIDKRLKKHTYNVSVDELSHAIDLTSDKNTPEEEKKILKGIVRFSNTDVRQIMKSRSDVVAMESRMTFKEVLNRIMESGYSRMPVYENNFDRVLGILHVKDVLAHIDKGDDFNWQSLLRQPYFVPESKKINDLLKEFQQMKSHMAIVVDEYGGSSGIVTLEDVLEEIVGEIHDEFDDDELLYSKLDDRTYVFEGKTLLNDFCRILEIDRKIFDSVHGEADTLAGMVLEIAGKIPEKNEKVYFDKYCFIVESADKKKINRIKVTIADTILK